MTSRSLSRDPSELHVASLRDAQHATSSRSDATTSETAAQPGMLKALATKALERLRTQPSLQPKCNKGVSSPNKADDHAVAPRDLVIPDPTDPLPYTPTWPELAELLGSDWHWIRSDVEVAKTCRQAETVRRMREAGIVPHSYTESTICRHCGPVPIFRGCPSEVLGCPWCFNRAKGLPVPRPPRASARGPGQTADGRSIPHSDLRRDLNHDFDE